MDSLKMNTGLKLEAQESCEVASPKDSMERLTEEARFEVVCKELDKGIKKPGLWLKAKTEAMGNIDMAEAIYAGLRVQSLKDEEDMLRAGSEAKIARKERVRLAEEAEAARVVEAEAARVVEAARSAEEARIEREIQKATVAHIAAVCDDGRWKDITTYRIPLDSCYFFRKL